MIDLTKFTTKTSATVPIYQNQFQYNRKKYLVTTTEDGWHQVELDGNRAVVVSPAYVAGTDLGVKPVKGYTYNNMFIFHNFDVAKRKYDKEVQMDLLFNTFQTFSSVEAVYWEDHRLYAYQPNYSDLRIYELKSLYDSGENVDLNAVKGITAELRTLYLFHDIQRTQVRLQTELLRKEEDRKQWLASLPGRLHTVFNSAGAKILNYSLSGHRATVDWKLETTGRKYNSVIDTRDFRVIEAGYCMSGDDRRHTAGSMVKLAEDYEERRLTHITRSLDDFDDDGGSRWDD